MNKSKKWKQIFADIESSEEYKNLDNELEQELINISECSDDNYGALTAMLVANSAYQITIASLKKGLYEDVDMYNEELLKLINKQNVKPEEICKGLTTYFLLSTLITIILIYPFTNALLLMKNLALCIAIFTCIASTGSHYLTSKKRINRLQQKIDNYKEEIENSKRCLTYLKKIEKLIDQTNVAATKKMDEILKRNNITEENYISFLIQEFDDYNDLQYQKLKEEPEKNKKNRLVRRRSR